MSDKGKEFKSAKIHSDTLKRLQIESSKAELSISEYIDSIIDKCESYKQIVKEDNACDPNYVYVAGSNIRVGISEIGRKNGITTY